MPGLTRNAPPLLRKVGNRTHATDKDHENALPTPPATNSTRSSGSSGNFEKEDEDMMREPESSEDEGLVGAPKSAERSSINGFLYPRLDGGKDEQPPTAPQFKRAPARSGPRKAVGSSKDDTTAQMSDSDGEIFGSQHSQKRRKGFSNIHTKKKTYAKHDNKPRKTLKSPRKQIPEKNHKPAQPAFKVAKGANDMFEFGATPKEVGFALPRCAAPETNEYNALSPSLSELSTPPDSPGVEEIMDLDLPEPKPYLAMTECALCGEQVELSLKQNFEDEYTQGKPMNYKWQQRFCRHHKRNAADELWMHRGYPRIDWGGLEARMRKHHSHLRDVMNGATPSIYRGQLGAKVKNRSKNAALNSESDWSKGRISVGYYGPRGEKIMTDHIIEHLNDVLREQATKDKVLAASGVSGGVSGYVQSILVPELAEQLIAEDMAGSGRSAREVIVEGAELGDLLNAEIEDQISEGFEV